MKPENLEVFWSKVTRVPLQTQYNAERTLYIRIHPIQSSSLIIWYFISVHQLIDELDSYAFELGHYLIYKE